MYEVVDNEPKEQYAVFLDPEGVLLAENETTSTSENVDCYDKRSSNNLERLLSNLNNWRIHKREQRPVQKLHFNRPIVPGKNLHFNKPISLRTWAFIIALFYFQIFQRKTNAEFGIRD